MDDIRESVLGEPGGDAWSLPPSGTLSGSCDGCGRCTCSGWPRWPRRIADRGVRGPRARVRVCACRQHAHATARTLAPARPGWHARTRGRMAEAGERRTVHGGSANGSGARSADGAETAGDATTTMAMTAIAATAAATAAPAATEAAAAAATAAKQPAAGADEPPDAAPAARIAPALPLQRAVGASAAISPRRPVLSPSPVMASGSGANTPATAQSGAASDGPVVHAPSAVPASAIAARTGSVTSTAQAALSSATAACADSAAPAGEAESAERHRLLDAVRDAARTILARYPSERPRLATMQDPYVSTLFSRLEAVFEHGLPPRQPAGPSGGLTVPGKDFFRSLSTSLFRAGDSRGAGADADSAALAPSASYWRLVSGLLAAPDRERFERLAYATTDLKRGRAWLRESLNEHSLGKFIGKLFTPDGRRLLAAGYEPHAFLRDADMLLGLRTVLATLNTVLFAIGTEDEHRDSVPSEHHLGAGTALSVRTSSIGSEAVAAPVGGAEPGGTLGAPSGADNLVVRNVRKRRTKATAAAAARPTTVAPEAAGPDTDDGAMLKEPMADAPAADDEPAADAAPASESLTVTQPLPTDNGDATVTGLSARELRDMLMDVTRKKNDVERSFRYDVRQRSRRSRAIAICPLPASVSHS